MERYNGLHPPFVCSSCPKKTFGDCHSLLIHSVLAHDKAYVMELHDQASPSEPIDNSLVQLLAPQIPLVQTKVAEEAEINPPLGDSSADDNEMNRALETVALFSQEIKSPSRVKVVPQQKRGSSEFGCSGKKNISLSFCILIISVPTLSPNILIAPEKLI